MIWSWLEGIPSGSCKYFKVKTTKFIKTVKTQIGFENHLQRIGNHQIKLSSIRLINIIPFVVVTSDFHLLLYSISKCCCNAGISKTFNSTIYENLFFILKNIIFDPLEHDGKKIST